jgi:S1-C subfamily serine protease
MNARPAEMKQVFLILTAAGLGLILAGRVQANAEVYERSLPSVAMIVKFVGRQPRANGTGVVVDAKHRLLLTNYHVVRGGEEFLVVFPAYDNRTVVAESAYYAVNLIRLGIKGKVIAHDSKRDLAVIQLRQMPVGVRPVMLAESSPRPGDTLHAIGNSGFPQPALWRYLKGEVRQVYFARYQTEVTGGTDIEVQARVVETQMPSNPGDSGGPVLNDRGELAAITQGVNSALRLVSVSIDVSEVRAFLGTVPGYSPASDTSLAALPSQ